MIRIRSKADGFRRCGVAHPAAPADYPDGRFTDGQVAALKAEPMLIVEEIAGAGPEAAAQAASDGDAQASGGRKAGRGKR